MIEAYNLGSQVPNEDFIKKALELHADVLLVSQTVTQKDVHIQNLTNLIELLEAEGLRDKFVVCCGGPRITHELAKELGYDAIHDTVHEMCKDEARHGRGFDGLLKRYFGK